jgi:hypothetical protein
MVRLSAALLALVFSLGCAVGSANTYPASAPARPATDAPVQFVAAVPLAGATAPDTVPGPGCHSPMFDPRDGTRIEMVVSAGGVADYEVPVGRYGVARDERLRLDCRTGQVIGVVPSQAR